MTTKTTEKTQTVPPAVQTATVPRPRTHARLWQAYLWWNELVEMRKRHLLRISAIEAGRSNLDAAMERQLLEWTDLDTLVPAAKKQMVELGEDVGPVWEWMTSIKGLAAGGLAAQLLAQIDDVSRYSTVSKLWRFCGQGLFRYWKDAKGDLRAPQAGWRWVTRAKKRVPEWTVTLPEPGWQLVNHRDVCLYGWKAPYNRRLKSICYLVASQFLRQQTPIYSDHYYAEKERQRELHPQRVRVNGRWRYNDGHLHHMALRKVAKLFLQHLWLVWRESENLPVTRPYVHDILGHSHLIPPPNWPLPPG